MSEEKQLPSPDGEPSEEALIHLCPACEDDFSSARAFVIRTLGASIALTPLLMVLLSFAAAMLGRTLVLDERIVMGCIAAWAAVIAYAFGKKELQNLRKP